MAYKEQAETTDRRSVSPQRVLQLQQAPLSVMPTVPFFCASNAWRQHQREIKAYLVHRLSDSALADDLLQDVFMRAMRQGEAFCTLANRRAWLFAVARNAVVDHLRRTKPQSPLPDDLAAETEAPDPLDTLTDCILRVLDHLPEEDADLIRQCDLQGMRLQGYADLRGLTLPAVKSRIRRARIRIRELIICTCQVNFDATGRVCCHVPCTPV
jgi:RNA polymerase sigma-70 factor, ECF subfamily